MGGPATPTGAAAPLAAAGWYLDPDGSGCPRYFDGRRWLPAASDTGAEPFDVCPPRVQRRLGAALVAACLAAWAAAAVLVAGAHHGPPPGSWTVPARAVAAVEVAAGSEGPWELRAAVPDADGDGEVSGLDLATAGVPLRVEVRAAAGTVTVDPYLDGAQRRDASGTVVVARFTLPHEGRYRVVNRSGTVVYALPAEDQGDGLPRSAAAGALWVAGLVLGVPGAVLAARRR